MSSNSRLFDEHLSKFARNEAMGLPREAGLGNAKVRKDGGCCGEGSKLPAALREDILERWRTQVGGAIGLPTYQSLLAFAREEVAGKAEVLQS